MHNALDTDTLCGPMCKVSSMRWFGRELALLRHEAEVHFQNLEPASDAANLKNVVSQLKERYGEGKVTEEICPNYGKKKRQFKKLVKRMDLTYSEVAWT